MIGEIDWSTIETPESGDLIESVQKLLQLRSFAVSGGIGQMLLGKEFRGACRLRENLSVDVEVTNPDPGGDEWIVLMRALPQRCVNVGEFRWKVQVGFYPDGDAQRATAGLQKAWKWAGKKVRAQLLGEMKRLATIAALVCTLREAAGELPRVVTMNDPRFVEVEAACPPDAIRALISAGNASPERSS